MKWTTTKPSRPGWYFYRYSQLDDAEAYWVFSAIFKDETRFYAGHRGEGGVWIDSWNGQWSSEPIAEPEEKTS